MNALIMTGPELEGHDRTAHSPFGQWGRPGQKRILRPHAAQILHLASASLMAILGACLETGHQGGSGSRATSARVW
jgi:hypothetical protein